MPVWENTVEPSGLRISLSGLPEFDGVIRRLARRGVVPLDPHVPRLKIGRFETPGRRPEKMVNATDLNALFKTRAHPDGCEKLLSKE